MSNLVWAQTKPSQPGWYWWRCGSKPIVVYVYETNRGLMVDERDIELELVANVFGQWSGPLEEPGEAIS